MKIRFFLIAIYAFTIYASCNKKLNCNNNIYFFSATIKATPDFDSIHINDTVWLEMTVPVQLSDNNGTTINYSGSNNFGIAIDFLKFTGGSVSSPGAIGAVGDFNYQLVSGIFIPDPVQAAKNRDYVLIESGGEYKFKLGVIPKTSATYAVSISNSSNVYRRNDECTKANFQITFANTDQHLYFYEQNRPGYIPSEYERTHIYCFKVN